MVLCYGSPKKIHTPSPLLPVDKVCLLSLAQKALFSWLSPCLHLCVFFCHIYCSHHSESVLLQADASAWNAFPAFVLTLGHSSTLNSGVISSSSTLPYTVAASHTRLLSTWSVACEKDELNFSLLLILKTEAQGVWKKYQLHVETIFQLLDCTKYC